MPALRPDVPAASGPALSAPALPEGALDGFVQLWSEMATHWGINRTMAQVHALLFASEAPLDTDAIMVRLDVSRGNANTNLRRLEDWGLVRRVHRDGSRKDFYEAETDVWKVTRQIIREREGREIKPLAQRLDACRAQLGPAPSGPEAHFAARLDDLLAFVRLFSGVSAALAPLLERQNAGLVTALVAFARALPSQAGPEA